MEPPVHKYDVLFDVIQKLEMRDIRSIFLAMRQIPGKDPNYFFPRYGFTAGEFSVGYVTTMPARSRLRKSKQNKGGSAE